MLSDALKDEIQGAYRAFLTSKGLRARLGQRLMIAHIARVLGGIKRNQDHQRSGGDHLCVVEAGTGTGKTLAYALAAIPIARECDKTLVIATATVALQEQILQRDLPDILRHSGLSFSLSLSKGRRRYLCLSKLDQMLSGAETQTMPLYPDEYSNHPDAIALDLYARFADQLARGNWDGDRDNWDAVLPDNQWQPVTTDHAQCSGRRCSHVKQCSFFKARESMAQADVVVANHDLVLADLALGGGAILPAPEDAIYIFDEAHHLPDKVINHFSANFRLGASERWLEQAERSVGAIIALPGLQSSLRGQFESLLNLLIAARKGLEPLRPLLMEWLAEGSERQGQRQFRFEDGRVPEELASHARGLRGAFADLVQHSEKLLDTLQDGLDKGTLEQRRDELEQWLADVAAMRFRCQGMLGLWQSYGGDTSNEKPPLARWLAQVDSGMGITDMELHSSPILAAKTLQNTLWSRCYGAVLTSATLTALGSFKRFSMRAGLYEDASFEIVPSPFAHAEAGEIYVPAMDCDAGDPEAHTRALIEMLPKIIDADAGSLVLFASKRQLNAVLEAVPADFRALVLAQGELPKQDILRRHRERLDGDKGSVIFGLASFAEGVDLPGKYCSHVLIAKIPFAVPEDPVEEALAEWITHNKGNPFMEITVPDAAVRLIQASGRLLRSESDRGRISILDRRIVTRQYGRKMLASMPPYQQIIE